jgi:hypothetical protein
MRLKSRLLQSNYMCADLVVCIFNQFHDANLLCVGAARLEDSAMQAAGSQTSCYAHMQQCSENFIH